MFRMITHTLNIVTHDDSDLCCGWKRNFDALKILKDLRFRLNIFIVIKVSIGGLTPRERKKL